MFEDVIATLDAVVDALNTAGVAYALCGGLAVNLHGHVRATRDIDLLLPLDQLEQLDPARSALRSLGFHIDAGPIPFSSGTDRAAVAMRVTCDFTSCRPRLTVSWGGCPTRGSIQGTDGSWGRA